MRVERVLLDGLDEQHGAPGVAMGMLSPGTSAERVRVDIATLEPGAMLPKHPAGREQVFYVVSGHGRVAGDDDVEQYVSAGSLVLWSPGEQHTTWADSPMTAVIIQRAAAERPATARRRTDEPPSATGSAPPIDEGDTPPRR